MGAQLMDPKATVQVVWTNTWFAPATERQAAESLVADGVSVLADGQDSPTTGQVAEAHGLKWTGYDSNQESFAPNSWLTATTYNWGPTTSNEVQAAMNGTWKSQFWYGSLADHFVIMAPFGKSVSQATRSAILRQGTADRQGHLRPVHRPHLRPERQDRRPEGRDPHGHAEVLDHLVRKGRSRQPQGLTALDDRLPCLTLETTRAASVAGAAQASSLPASALDDSPKALAVRAIDMTKRFPGVVAQRPGVVRGGRRRSARAARRERGRKDHALQPAHGPLPARRGKAVRRGQARTVPLPQGGPGAGIFMVHQHLRLVESMTVAENVVLGSSTSRLRFSPRAVEKTVAESAERFQMSVDPGARIWQLSLGERQRVEILKALCRGAGS